MKTLLSLFAIVCTLTFSQAQTDGVTVSVTIENVLNDEGNLLASLHTAETFMKAQGIKMSSVAAKKGAVTITFENVAPGTYAIMILHDANGNNKMDFQANGMPKESYGTTGEMNMYGPPTFKDSSFTVAEEPVSHTIRF
ncbi:DUF2141 domain-containing protein [Croceivirga sp. JEA036]|uniref:DUF2141 domain-containing protein n=1 Tax=Croceivirga sp. JEA036 TaxID=2721162 RepID=UPI00143BD8AF|nr:DUF2141 domain-containing protein [Croceivirga sp. JEA036]NJB37729.1 DUF2141 domain-containing protein [Croceivirga sp. JEA036]